MNHEKCQKVVITIPVLLTGGTEIQTLTLVKVLVRAGYEVIVCCFYEFDQCMVNQMRQASAKVALLNQNWNDGLWSILKNVTLFLREEKPYIVHVQYMAPGFIAVLSARLAGVRTVFATVHQPGRTYGWKAKALLRLAASMCTSFFCISRSVEESWFGTSTLFDAEALKKYRHCTIYNAVDIDQVQELVEKGKQENLRRQLNLDEGTVIGCIARLRCEKGQSFLIDALAEILKDLPSVRLVIIGEGPDRSALLDQADQLNISNSIVWLGPMSHSETMRHLAVMDVLAVPSLFEGFGLVAAEAMAAGIPVVASQTDGLTEVIDQGRTGLLFEPGNCKEMTDALVYMLESKNRQREYGESGKERVRELFALHAFEHSISRAYIYYSSHQAGQ